MDEFLVNLSKVMAHSVVYFRDKIDAIGFSGPEFHQAPAGSETTADMLTALTTHLPELMAVTNEQILPNELAQLEASRQVSPGYSEINRDIYDTIGRDLNQIGNEIARANALAQAGTDLEVLRGPGGELVKEARKAAEVYDPEYFQTRDLMADRLKDLMSGDLTGGEREEITRAVSRGDVGSGTLDTGSQLNVVGNAMTFGNTTRDRLAQAVALATNTLPTMKSNVDVFQQATGRPSMVNTGESRTGSAKTQGIGSQAQAQSANLMNQIGANMRQSVGINSGPRAAGPSTIDKIGQVGGLMNMFNPFG